MNGKSKQNHELPVQFTDKDSLHISTQNTLLEQQQIYNSLLTDSRCKSEFKRKTYIFFLINTKGKHICFLKENIYLAKQDHIHINNCPP